MWRQDMFYFGVDRFRSTFAGAQSNLKNRAFGVRVVWFRVAHFRIGWNEHEWNRHEADHVVPRSPALPHTQTGSRKNRAILLLPDRAPACVSVTPRELVS